MRFLIPIILILFTSATLFAQTAVSDRELTYQTAIYFNRNKSDILKNYRNNNTALVKLLSFIDALNSDSLRTITDMTIEGTASPEGDSIINKRISAARAEELYNFLVSSRQFSTKAKIISSVHSWESTFQLMDSIGYPYTNEIKEIINSDDVNTADDINKSILILKRLKALRNGEVWEYLDNELFPALRATIVTLIYRERRSMLIVEDFLEIPQVSLTYSSPSAQTLDFIQLPQKRIFKTHLALSTNMLYDVALVPNIGLEYDLGKHWSVGGNWMYAWWKTDKRHDYWRIYGGDVHVQRWFGRNNKLFAGHHLGLYGQIVTYDFELGHRGYLGDKWSYAAGIVYGYSWPIKHRLRIDASIYAGYLTGEYKEYLPIDTHYVWQVTKQRHYYGPTQVQVSLVWLLDKTPLWR